MTGNEDQQSEVDDVIDLQDGRRVIRVPKGPDGKPVRPGLKIGHANLGSRPRVTRIPKPRILEVYEHPNGEVRAVLVAYPALRVLREGSEIDVDERGQFRIVKAVQLHSRDHPEKRDREVLFELRLEPA